MLRATLYPRQYVYDFAPPTSSSAALPYPRAGAARARAAPLRDVRDSIQL